MKIVKITESKLQLGLLLAVGSTLLSSTSAQAALISSYQFNGKGNWSIDAVGSNSTPVGTLDAIIPVGSTIEQAFLYSTTLFNAGSFVPTVNFNGTVYSGADWTNLGTFTLGDLTAFRTDVTAQIATAIGGGSVNPFNFTVESENPNFSIDGEVLAIVYSNPAEKERTIAFLDGGTVPGGDTTMINLANPLTNAQLTDPNFEALMSLGIGFSFQGTDQFSTVDVNGTRLTSAAGGQDDGIGENGGLVTVGGIGDSPTNPANPFAGPNGDPRFDDELYDLTPLLKVGDKQIRIDTTNPSNDDNIFFLGLNITAVAGVNQPPPPPQSVIVPEPSPILGLLGLAALTLSSRGFRKQN